MIQLSIQHLAERPEPCRERARRSAIATLERILNAELDEHLGLERAEGGGNRRNGTSRKTVLTGTSKLTIAVPRGRESSFDPQLIAKYQRRFPDGVCPRAGKAGPGGSQDRLDVCAGPLGPREPRPPRGDLRHRGLTRPDLGGDRCGS